MYLNALARMVNMSRYEAYVPELRRPGLLYVLQRQRDFATVELIAKYNQAIQLCPAWHRQKASSSRSKECSMTCNTFCLVWIITSAMTRTFIPLPELRPSSHPLPTL